MLVVAAIIFILFGFLFSPLRTSRFFEVGIFYAFVMWFACAYFAGRAMTCPS